MNQPVQFPFPSPDNILGTSPKFSGDQDDEIYIRRTDILNYLLKLENHFLKNDELASEVIPELAKMFKSLKYGMKK